MAFVVPVVAAPPVVVPLPVMIPRAVPPSVVVSPPQSPPVCVEIQAEDCVASPAPPVVVLALIPVMFSKGG